MQARAEKLIRRKFSSFQAIYEKMPIALQNALVSLRGWHLSRIRYSKGFWRLLEEITAHDRFSREELINYQNHRLRILVHHAYRNVPYYNSIMKKLNIRPDDIITEKDLRRMPILTREDVRSNLYELLDQMIPSSKQIVVHTSGSTGSGLPVAYDQDSYVAYEAFGVRQFIWAGVDPMDWRITLFGSRIVPPNQMQEPYWRTNYFGKQIMVSIYHLSQSTKHQYIEFLKEHSGMVLEGFPTALNVLADFLLEESVTVKMKMVYSTGEPISDVMRQRIQNAFDCKVYDSYGMTEMVGYIQECEHGRHHLISDCGLLEIVDDEGNPVPSGEEGYFVWTGLHKLNMPLIRYKIGDKGILDGNQHCHCARPYPIVNPTITRDSDYLVHSDGRILSPRVINQFLKDKTSFKACQLIQESTEKIVIRIVPGNGHYEKDRDSLRADLQKLLGARVAFEVVESDRPLTRAQGKIPLILNKLILDKNQQVKHSEILIHENRKDHTT